MAQKTPAKLSNAAPPNEAREQAEAYESLFAPRHLELDDGETIQIPPHPNLGMWDDEQQAEYEELLFETESYDRGPDVFIPEQRLRDKDGTETGVVLPAETRPGPLLTPYRKQGELVKPPHSVRIVQAALGEDGYKRLREGGRSAADVWRIWNKQGFELTDRQKSGPKDAESDMDLETVPTPDS